MRTHAIWRAPLRRARRAVASAGGRIETSSRVIDATLRFGADRPMQRVRQLWQLSRWIDEAEQRLHHALCLTEEALAQVALAPEQAEDSPLPFLDAALRCVETIVRLDDVARRVTEASARMVEETRVWAESAQAGTVTAAPAVQAARTASPRHPRIVLVIVRRAPAAPATVADAARKVSRGRAPPLSRPADSIHRS